MENSRYKFDTRKTGDEVRNHAKALGYKIDDEDFKRGGDWLWFRRMSPKGNQMPVQVKYNTFNGCFYAWTPFADEPCSESSVKLEGTEWYDELLFMFYRPDVQVGDHVTINAQGLVVRGIVAVVNWWEHGGWDIEIEQANVTGGYSRWKQREDGGFLVGYVPKSHLPEKEEV